MFTADLLERATKTWVQTFLTVFLGALVVPANVFSVGAWKAAALAALAGAVSAAFSGAMSVLSKRVGDKSSASILPVPAIDVPSTVVSTTVPPTATATAAAPVGSQTIEHIDPASIPGYASTVPAPPPITEAHQTDPVQSADAR